MGARKHDGESISVSARVRVREMVAALDYMEMRGVYPRTRSEIVSLCVQAVAGIIPQGRWKSLGEAISVLDGRFPVATRKGLELITTQTSQTKRQMILNSENAWQGIGVQSSQELQPQVVGSARPVCAQAGPRPEMRQKDGVMYIIHPTLEGYQRDCEMYRKMIEDGRAKVVMKEEWDAIDRPPNLAPPQDWLDKAVAAGEGNPTEGCK